MPSIGKILAMRGQPLQVATLQPKVYEYSVDIDLPASEPTDPLVSWTITQDMMPQTSANVLCNYTLCVWAAGRQGASNATLYYGIGQNDSYSTASSSTDANKYYTVNDTGKANITVGTNIGLKLWTDSAGAKLLFYGFCIYPARIGIVGATGNLLKDIVVKHSAYPTFTLGNPSVDSTWNNLYLYSYDVQVTTYQQWGDLNIASAVPGNNYRLIRPYLGDNALTCSIITNDSYYPYYRQTHIPNQIYYRM